MEQKELFEIEYPYRYIIDTCSLLMQSEGYSYRRKLFGSKWDMVDSLIRNKSIVMCSEVYEEVQNEDIIDSLKQNECLILPIDNTIQSNVKKILKAVPEILDFKDCTSSGDVFLIATAMKYNLTIITEESNKSYKKIPMVASKFGVRSISIVDFWDENDVYY